MGWLWASREDAASSAKDSRSVADSVKELKESSAKQLREASKEISTAGASIPKAASEITADASQPTSLVLTKTSSLTSNVQLAALVAGSAAATYVLLKFHRRYLRRISTAIHIPSSYFYKRSIFGKVTRVGDGDNFRLFHTPGGRLAGWGWLPGKRIPREPKKLKDQTIHVRLAGVDAPELAHFGKPAQKHGDEALAWLKEYVNGKRVRVYLYRRDQYERVVGRAVIRKWGFKRDVGHEMLKMGWATVYEGKASAEFGDKETEALYKKTEARAKGKGIGIWAKDGVFGTFGLIKKKTKNETPGEFKRRTAASDVSSQ